MIPIPEPEPMDIAMLDASEVEKLVTASAVVPTKKVMDTARPKTIANGASAADVTVGAIEPGPREINPMFSMRNGRQIDLRLTGAEAYTAAELAAFNKRRQAKAVFEPYR